MATASASVSLDQSEFGQCPGPRLNRGLFSELRSVFVVVMTCVVVYVDWCSCAHGQIRCTCCCCDVVVPLPVVCFVALTPQMMLPTHNRMGAPYPRVRLDRASTDVPAAPQADLKDSKGSTDVDANRTADAEDHRSNHPVQSNTAQHESAANADADADPVIRAARLAVSAQAHAAHLRSLADNAFTDKLRDLCFDASRAIGAVEWVRYGYEVSTKIPCTVIHPEVNVQVSASAMSTDETQSGIRAVRWDLFMVWE